MADGFLGETMTFSFFATLLGGGAEIRGRQVAAALNGRINPEAGYEDDVCNYILGATPNAQAK